MKLKGALLLLFVLFVLMVSYTFGRSRVDAYRSDYTYRLHAASINLPDEIIVALAGEFKGLVADYLLLEAAAFIGSDNSINATEADWNAVARLLESSSILDPYFKQTYRLTQATLPWHAKKIEETLTILKRSKKHLPWDWQPGFFIGFNYHYFLKNNETASKELMEASRIPDAPVMLATLAARLASKAGQTRAAIEFLNSILENTTDESIKEDLKARIMALSGVDELERAVVQFKEKFERFPVSLDELVDSSIIPSLPDHPYGREYTLVDGTVGF